MKETTVKVSGEALEETFPESPQLFADSKAYLAAEDVILALRDFFQQLAIDIDQHPQRGLAVFRYMGAQLLAGLIVLAGAVSFHGEQRSKASYVRRGKQFGGRQAELCKVLL